MSDLTIAFHMLVALNVVQLFFWGYQVQRLVEKLMSRNYYDYQVAESINKEKPLTAPKIDEFIPDDMRVLNEINPF